MFVTSAESAFAASSNETRVRVEASAKKRMTVRPRRGGRDGSGAEGSRSWLGSDRGRYRSRHATSRRCRERGVGSISCRHLRYDLDLVAAIHLREVHADIVAGGRRHVLSDEIGPDRKLAVSAIDEDRETYRLRTSVVDERVHRGADRAAGEEDIVDEHDHAAVHRERDLGLADDRRVADARQVVAIKSDVDGAEREVDALVRADRRLDAGGERVTARADTDDC